MADTLLHLTLAESLRNSGTLPIDLRHCIDSAREEYHLGAVFIDLPFFDGLARNALRLAAGRPVVYHPTGERFHERDAHALHCAFTESATTRAQISLVLGMWTHYAADRVFHREIESRIRAATRSGRSCSHRTLEGQIGLHCHYEILGVSGEGSPYAKSAMTIRPRSDWAGFCATVLGGVPGISATPQLLKDWLLSLQLYGILHSRRFPWVTWLPDDDPELLAASLRLYTEALNLAGQFVCAAHARMTGAMTAADFRAAIPAVRLSDGMPA